MSVKRLGALVMALGLAGVLLPATVAAAGGSWNVAGTYGITVRYAGDDYPETLTLTQSGGGTITGTSLGPPCSPSCSTFNITGGSVVGDTITIVATSPFTLTLTADIALDGSMSGSWEDGLGGLGRSGTWWTTSGHARFVYYDTPSTNDINRTNGWAHVDVTVGPGSATMTFITTRNFYSCFEYRTDGDTSQILTENGGVNYNTVILDGLYPYGCVTGGSLSVPVTKTVTVSCVAAYVEVRMVFGAERDERFDWTRFNVLPGDCDGPITTNVFGTPNPVAITGAVAVTANVDDTTTGGSDIASAEYNLDGGSWTAMNASDLAFDEVSEDVTASFAAPATPGVYDLCVRGTDVVLNVGDPACTMLVVFDPSGGFVTGGGWIMSPEGAYAANPTLTGKATFGFVSKYKKGASIPDGNTEFQFRGGGLNFSSTNYQWLVVNQNYTNAQFKGTGTINGAGAYGFMLWATDGSPDTFRIQITDAGGAIVYDNGVQQPIGGGSIVVHK